MRLSESLVRLGYSAPVIVLGALACVPRERPGEQENGPAPAASAKRSSALAPKKTPSVASNDQNGVADNDNEADGDGEPGGALLTEKFSTDFSGTALAPVWNATSPTWKLNAGRLCAENARNHPIWLTYRLPVNARIEFTAESGSADGDIKVELWGDGLGAATATSYTNATSYLAIFGGWKNRFHVLARLDEHGSDRRELVLVPGSDDPRARPVVPHQSYRFKLERRDRRTVRWYVDDIEIHSFVDTDPLRGPGHEHFGFNDWQVPVCFDDLAITPIEER